MNKDWLCICLLNCLVVSHSLWPQWTAVHQVPLSMGFPRHEYWSGLPFPSPGDLPEAGIKPVSPASLSNLRWILYLWATKEALNKKQITVIIWLEVDGRVWRREEYHSVYIFVLHGILTVQKTKLQIIFNWENFLKLLKSQACQLLSFPGGSDGKESTYNAGDLGLIPGFGRSPGEGNGNPLQYSCLENPMDCSLPGSSVYRVARVGHNLVTNPAPP